MKNLLIIAALFVGGNAFALSQNSSWEEINASYKTNVKAPQVAFAAGQATSFVTVFDVCHAGDTVRTTKAMPIYKQVRHGRDGMELVQVGSEVLETSSSYTVTIDPEHGPSRTVNMEIGRFYNIDVFAASRNDRSEGNLLFTKSFTMPICD